MIPPPACSCGITKISYCGDAARDVLDFAPCGGGGCGGGTWSRELCGGGRGADIGCGEVVVVAAKG